MGGSQGVQQLCHQGDRVTRTVGDTQSWLWPSAGLRIKHQQEGKSSQAGVKSKVKPTHKSCPWLQLNFRGSLGFTRARDELKKPFSACSPSKEHHAVKVPGGVPGHTLGHRLGAKPAPEPPQELRQLLPGQSHLPRSPTAQESFPNQLQFWLHPQDCPIPPPKPL